MITDIYHLTNGTKWAKTKKEGILKPMSDPWFDGCKIPKNREAYLKRVIAFDAYLVGIHPKSLRSWKRWGQLSDLEKFVRDGGVDSPECKVPIIYLRIPVLDLSKGFVREFKFRTPRFLDQSSPNLYARYYDVMSSYGMNDMTKKEWEIYERLETRSLCSAVPLSKYTDQFEVPEVWLHQETPVNLVEVVKIVQPRRVKKRR